VNIASLLKLKKLPIPDEARRRMAIIMPPAAGELKKVLPVVLILFANHPCQGPRYTKATPSRKVGEMFK
jgi:hypothetical protein